MNFWQVKDYFEEFCFLEPYEYPHWRTGETVRGVATHRSWDGVDELLYSENPREFEGLGTVHRIEKVGGVGEGDHMHMILHVTFPDKTERLYQKNGRWASHEGAYWEYGDFFEVEPVQETVTVYKKVGK